MGFKNLRISPKHVVQSNDTLLLPRDIEVVGADTAGYKAITSHLTGKLGCNVISKNAPGDCLCILLGHPDEYPELQSICKEDDFQSFINHFKNDNAYAIVVRDKRIILCAPGASGLLTGAHVLSKLFDVDPAGNASIQHLKILDWPEFGFRGIHLEIPADETALSRLAYAAEELFPTLGINNVVCEFNYNIRYASHPEVCMERAISQDALKRTVEIFRANHISVIPQFQCLGHQSWKSRTFPLLLRHPEFDETPELPYNNPDIYCRSWCPRHPNINRFIFDLMDEIIEIFEPTHFHVGMDEVFILGQCERCRGVPYDELLASAIREYHSYLSAQNIGMMMWGDRLLPQHEFDYNDMESSGTDTWKAVDEIPTDIIITDWHYMRKQKSYPSFDYFLDKGFRVIACPWKHVANIATMFSAVRNTENERLLGMMLTTWFDSNRVISALSKGCSTDEPDVEFIRFLEAARFFCKTAW